MTYCASVYKCYNNSKYTDFRFHGSTLRGSSAMTRKFQSTEVAA